MYQLFVFFMITDPKTTVRTWATPVRRRVPGRGGRDDPAAVNEVIYAPYYALFLVSPVTNLAEIWWTRRQTKKREGETGAEREASESAPCQQSTAGSGSAGASPSR